MLPIWLLIVVLTKEVVCVTSTDYPDYVFRAYNCSHPTHRLDLAYQTPRACEQPVIWTQQKDIQLQILQKDKYVRVPGYSCQYRLRQETSYCGAEHHITHVPQDTHRHWRRWSLDEETCRHMRTTKTYKDPTGVTRHLILGSVEFSYFRRGKSWTTAKTVYCQGELAMLAGEEHVSYNLVQQITVQITLEDMILLINQHEVRETLPGKKKATYTLPCLPYKNVCVQQSVTHIWDYTGVQEKCYLSAIRNSQGKVASTREQEQVYVSTDHTMIKLMLKETTQHCGRTVWSTNHADIFAYNLAGGQAFERPVDPRDTSHFNYIDGKDTFLYHQIREGLEGEMQAALKKECLRHLEDNQIITWGKHRDAGITTWLVGNGTFATIAGEVIYTYQCEPTLVVGRATERCYQGMMVTPYPGGARVQEMYMDPLTHRLTGRSPEVPCNGQMGAKFRNANGDWVKVSPNLALTQPPHLLPESWDLQGNYHDRMQDWNWDMGGIYTPAQKRAMEEQRNQRRKQDDAISRLVEQSRPHLFQRGIWTHSQVFPDFDSQGVLPRVYRGVLEFIEDWGTEAGAFFALYLLVTAIGTIVGLGYRLLILHEVHGCGRMLCWGACFKALYSKNYLQYKKNVQEAKLKQGLHPQIYKNLEESRRKMNRRTNPSSSAEDQLRMPLPMTKWDDFKNQPLRRPVYPYLPRIPSSESLTEDVGTIQRLMQSVST